jgi:hypothetical protein
MKFPYNNQGLKPSFIICLYNQKPHILILIPIQIQIFIWAKVSQIVTIRFHRDGALKNQVILIF